MKELAKALESISSLRCLESKIDVVGRQQSDAETTKAPQAQKSAQERLDEARAAFAFIKADRKARRDAALQVIDKQFAAPLREARKQIAIEQQALDEERVARLADEGPAIGSRYVEYKYDNWSGSRQLTGRVAVVEQRTASTQFPDNMAYWRKPEAGEKFLRTLKEDGTPDIQFDRLGTLDWIPEGTEKK